MTRKQVEIVASAAGLVWVCAIVSAVVGLDVAWTVILVGMAVAVTTAAVVGRWVSPLRSVWAAGVAVGASAHRDDEEPHAAE